MINKFDYIFGVVLFILVWDLRAYYKNVLQQNLTRKQQEWVNNMRYPHLYKFANLVSIVTGIVFLIFYIEKYRLNEEGSQEEFPGFPSTPPLLPECRRCDRDGRACALKLRLEDWVILFGSVHGSFRPRPQECEMAHPLDLK